MERSIETIWKEGFLHHDSLTVPKVHNLYNQKSMHVVDRFKRTGKRNLYGIAIGAVVVLLYTIWVKVPWVGVFIALLLAHLIRIGRKQATELAQIQYGVSSYVYLHAFDQWLKKSIEEYRQVYRYVYPLLFLAIILGLFYAQLPGFESIMSRIMSDPDTYLVMGLPIYWIMAMAAFVILAFFLSGALYKFDLYAIYGSIFKKLEELLADMEELRREA